MHAVAVLADAMLALQMSHRAVRLHTFEQDDRRAYTSTPTKIGGHCLDHVRNGFWDGRPSRHGEHASFDPRGRFGGLCGQILQLDPPPSRNVSPLRHAQDSRRWIFPLCRPPDVHYEWRNDCDMQLQNRAESIVENGELPVANAQDAAVGPHEACALVGIFLSKYADSLWQGNSAEATGASANTAELGVCPSRERAGDINVADVVEASPDRPCQVARDISGVCDAQGAWAWQARLRLCPAYSKLRRYSFVRELGRGSHGTVLLMRRGAGNGSLCVLKESQSVSEAVNEAHLLLLLGGHDAQCRRMYPLDSGGCHVEYNEVDASRRAGYWAERNEVGSARHSRLRGHDRLHRGSVIQVRVKGKRASRITVGAGHSKL